MLILSIIWSILIFVLCTMPTSGLPKIRIPNVDKIVHFGFFFVQSILFSIILYLHANLRLYKILLLTTVLAVFYGGFIEILQDKFFNRQGDIIDVIADTIGGIVGTLVYPLALKCIEPLFRKST
ncbi:MAG: VanZ family protein [Tannerella sp.]|nr:VanZ family protein [Tannerella sp.]